MLLCKQFQVCRSLLAAPASVPPPVLPTTLACCHSRPPVLPSTLAVVLRCRWHAYELPVGQELLRGRPAGARRLPLDVRHLQATRVQRLRRRGRAGRLRSLPVGSISSVPSTRYHATVGHARSPQPPTWLVAVVCAAGVLQSCSAAKNFCEADPRVPRGCPKTCGVSPNSVALVVSSSATLG